jgi:hypothetical protein
MKLHMKLQMARSIMARVSALIAIPAIAATAGSQQAYGQASSESLLRVFQRSIVRVSVQFPNSYGGYFNQVGTGVIAGTDVKAGLVYIVTARHVLYPKSLIDGHPGAAVPQPSDPTAPAFPRITVEFDQSLHRDSVTTTAPPTFALGPKDLAVITIQGRAARPCFWNTTDNRTNDAVQIAGRTAYIIGFRIPDAQRTALGPAVLDTVATAVHSVPGMQAGTIRIDHAVADAFSGAPIIDPISFSIYGVLFQSDPNHGESIAYNGRSIRNLMENIVRQPIEELDYQDVDTKRCRDTLLNPPS